METFIFVTCLLSNGIIPLGAPVSAVKHPNSFGAYFDQDATGSWSAPINMGDQINSPADENRPFVSLDGRYFFFTSDRVSEDESLKRLRPDLRTGNGSRDIYWVDARIIGELRPAGEGG